MKTLSIVALTAALALGGSLALAQNSGPADKGSTGWTGGSQNPGDKGASDLDKNSPEAGNVYAEGLDLKGPPRQFPPGRPPE